MAQWQAAKSYPVPSVSESEIPYSMAPSQERRVAPSQTRVVQIAAAGGNQVDGGLLAFNISAPSHLIKSGSCYLRGKIEVTTGAAGGWAFLGGELGDVGSAAGIIQKFTLMAQGNVIEQINNVRDLYGLLLTHTNKSYCEADACVKERRGFTAGATATKYDFVIPVFSGLLNNGKNFPAYLTSQVSLNFDLNPVKQALRAAAATEANPTKYEISEAFLVYEAVEPDNSYLAAVRQRLASGEAYALNYVTYKHQQMANQATISALQGLSSSSLRAVLFTKIDNAAGTNSTATDGRYNDDYAASSDADIILQLDGRDILGTKLNSANVQFTEMERALGRLGSPDLNSALSGSTTAAKITDYTERKWLCGINCNRDDSANMAFSGTPVNQLLLRVAGAAAGASLTFHMWSVVDQVLMISADGSSRVVQ